MIKNDRCVDMHIHSTASDGALSPENCIKQAIDRGVCKMSLADHDTIAGYSEIGSSYEDIKIITGVELSAKYDKELHILGYGFDRNAKPINDIFAYMKEERVHRNKCIVKKLNKIGIDLDYDEMLGNYDSDTFGRVHIAKELIKNGYAVDVENAFEKFLSKGRAAYCERELLEKEKCIAAIKESGGIAVLAHPIFLSLHRQDLIRFIDELKEMGLGGIEAYHPSQDEAYSLYIISICEDRHLYCTAGSDTHGLPHEIYSPVLIKNEYVIKSINEIFERSDSFKAKTKTSR